MQNRSHLSQLLLYWLLSGEEMEENRGRELGAGAQLEKKNFPGPAKHHRHQSEDIVCEEQWLPSQSRSLCVVAHLRSQNPPLTGEITGLSNQQMQTAENNIMGSPQRGILRGPRRRDAQITANKESRKLTLSESVAVYFLVKLTL